MNQLCAPNFRHSNAFEMPKFRQRIKPLLEKKIPKIQRKNLCNAKENRMIKGESVLYAADLLIEMQFSLELISIVTCKYRLANDCAIATLLAILACFCTWH